jgi:Trypsin-like peptidase domain
MLHSRTLSLLTMALFIGTGCASDSTAQPPGERPYILGGKLDAGDLYPSAVMLSARRTSKEVGDCSGAVISPRRILTAAHCVCLEKPVPSALRSARTMIDGSVCLKAVTVTAALYGRTPAEKSYLGIKIEPHPELKLFYDENGSLVFAESDLAVIHLENPLPGIPTVDLSEQEVAPGSAVAMAGFGDIDIQSQETSRKRYFGRTEIAQVEGELLRVLKAGVHAYAGDSGGPCFKWEEGRSRPMLVGIIRGGSAPVYSTITSTAFPRNREWLKKIIREDISTP